MSSVLTTNNTLECIKGVVSMEMWKKKPNLAFIFPVLRTTCDTQGGRMSSYVQKSLGFHLFSRHIINNNPFHSQKYPALCDKLYCHPVYTEPSRLCHHLFLLFTLSEKPLKPHTFKYLRIQNTNIVFNFKPHVDARQAESGNVHLSHGGCQNRTSNHPPWVSL